MKSNLNELTKGIVKENPSLVTLLGMCPTLAITTMAENGIGMGLATTFVLFFSNLFLSLLKNIIPNKVRLPAYIVVIAGFVTIVELLVRRYLPPLYDSLGIYLPLIAVNCIILGRAEVFASKNKPLASIFDAVGMGIGFTIALVAIGSVREIMGSGTWMGFNLHLPMTMQIFILPSGGFFVLGLVIAVINKINNRKPPQELGCKACPNSEGCGNSGGCEV